MQNEVFRALFGFHSLGRTSRKSRARKLPPRDQWAVHSVSEQKQQKSFCNSKRRFGELATIYCFRKYTKLMTSFTVFSIRAWGFELWLWRRHEYTMWCVWAHRLLLISECLGGWFVGSFHSRLSVSSRCAIRDRPRDGLLLECVTTIAWILSRLLLRISPSCLLSGILIPLRCVCSTFFFSVQQETKETQRRKQESFSRAHKLYSRNSCLRYDFWVSALFYRPLATGRGLTWT